MILFYSAYLFILLLFSVLGCIVMYDETLKTIPKEDTRIAIELLVLAVVIERGITFFFLANSLDVIAVALMLIGLNSLVYRSRDFFQGYYWLVVHLMLNVGVLALISLSMSHTARCDLYSSVSRGQELLIPSFWCN